MSFAEDVSIRPYLLRAVYEWCVEKKYTPYLATDAQRNDVQIPSAAGGDKIVILNISPSAVRDLTINDMVMFTARFNGVTSHVILPTGAVTGIYARETGSGLSFSSVANDSSSVQPSDDKPNLRVV